MVLLGANPLPLEQAARARLARVTASL